MVYFEVHVIEDVRNYCSTHGMPEPTFLAHQEHGGDYYKSTFEVWEQLYRYGGYDSEGYPLAAGCYPL